MQKNVTVKLTSGMDLMGTYNAAKEILGAPSEARMYVWVPETTGFEAALFAADAATAAEKAKGPFLLALVGYEAGSKATQAAFERAFRKELPDNLVVAYVG